MLLTTCYKRESSGFENNFTRRISRHRNYVLSKVDGWQLVEDLTLPEECKEKIEETFSRYGKEEGTKVLLQYLEKHDDGNTWSEFLHALKSQNYESIARVLESGSFDNQESEHEKNAMNHFYKELTQRVRPTDIIPHLFQKDVINQMDKEEIFAKERNHGITHAMRVLIKRVGDRNDHWFLTFIQSLKEAKYTEIAERMEAYVQEKEGTEEQRNCQSPLQDELIQPEISRSCVNRKKWILCLIIPIIVTIIVVVIMINRQSSSETFESKWTTFTTKSVQTTLNATTMSVVSLSKSTEDHSPTVSVPTIVENSTPRFSAVNFNDIIAGTVTFQNVHMMSGILYDNSTGELKILSGGIYYLACTLISFEDPTHVDIFNGKSNLETISLKPDSTAIDSATKVSPFILNTNQRLTFRISSDMATGGTGVSLWKIIQEQPVVIQISGPPQAELAHSNIILNTVDHNFSNATIRDGALIIKDEGTYMISVQFTSGRSMRSDVMLKRNNEILAQLTTRSNLTGDKTDSSSGIFIVDLQEDDVIHIFGNGAVYLQSITLSAVRIYHKGAPEKVAFSAVSNGYYTDTSIQFTHKILHNDHGAFNGSTGIFICPIGGLYMFSWTLSAYTDTTLETVILVNGLAYSNSYGTARTAPIDYHNCHSVVLLELKVGDRVTVKRKMGYIRSEYSSFSGYRISNI